jgi:hypothetical protein
MVTLRGCSEFHVCQDLRRAATGLTFGVAAGTVAGRAVLHQVAGPCSTGA